MNRLTYCLIALAVPLVICASCAPKKMNDAFVATGQNINDADSLRRWALEWGKKAAVSAVGDAKAYIGVTTTALDDQHQGKAIAAATVSLGNAETDREQLKRIISRYDQDRWVNAALVAEHWFHVIVIVAAAVLLLAVVLKVWGEASGNGLVKFASTALWALLTFCLTPIKSVAGWLGRKLQTPPAPTPGNTPAQKIASVLA